MGEDNKDVKAAEEKRAHEAKAREAKAAEERKAHEAKAKADKAKADVKKDERADETVKVDKEAHTKTTTKRKGKKAKQIYFGKWSSFEDMMATFGNPSTARNTFPDEGHIRLASYVDTDNGGRAYVMFAMSGKLYEVNCSNRDGGLLGLNQWDPDEVPKEDMEARVADMRRAADADEETEVIDGSDEHEKDEAGNAILDESGKPVLKVIGDDEEGKLGTEATRAAAEKNKDRSFLDEHPEEVRDLFATLTGEAAG